MSYDPARGRASLRRLYARAEQRRSDVQGHRPRFLDAVVCRPAPTVVELGTRGGVSTVAWLYGIELAGGQLWTVDLTPAPPIETRVTWFHLVGDDCSPEVLTRVPNAIDVLFIDTSHELAHTLTELEAYYPRVRPGGVVFLHDTALEFPDGCSPEEPFPVRTAIERFAVAHGLTWTEHDGSYGLGQIDVPADAL